jgi:hypothetical protein
VATLTRAHDNRIAQIEYIRTRRHSPAIERHTALLHDPARFTAAADPPRSEQHIGDG